MRALVRILALFATVLATITPVGAGTRLKDILDIEGVRENQLLGYGVVTGLNGTGDSLRNCAFTRQSLESMMERLGINTRNAVLNTQNAAAVMPRPSWPAATHRPGSHIPTRGRPSGVAGRKPTQVRSARRRFRPGM